MIDRACRYYDGDEDCDKCVKYGYIFFCPSGCEEEEVEKDRKRRENESNSAL